MTPCDTSAPLAPKHTGGRYHSALDWEIFNGCNKYQIKSNQIKFLHSTTKIIYGLHL